MKSITLALNDSNHFYYNTEEEVSICGGEVEKMLKTKTRRPPQQIVLTLNPEGAHTFKFNAWEGALDGRFVIVHARLARFMVKNGWTKVTFDIRAV